jgi:hypothetical protein
MYGLDSTKLWKLVDCPKCKASGEVCSVCGLSDYDCHCPEPRTWIKCDECEGGKVER